MHNTYTLVFTLMYILYLSHALTLRAYLQPYSGYSYSVQNTTIRLLMVKIYNYVLWLSYVIVSIQLNCDKIIEKKRVYYKNIFLCWLVSTFI